MKTKLLIFSAFLSFSVAVNSNEKPYRDIIWNALLCSEFGYYSGFDEYLKHSSNLRKLAKISLKEWVYLSRNGNINNLFRGTAKPVSEKIGKPPKPLDYNLSFNESDEYIFGFYSGIAKDRVANTLGLNFDEYIRYYEKYNCHLLARE